MMHDTPAFTFVISLQCGFGVMFVNSNASFACEPLVNNNVHNLVYVIQLEQLHALQNDRYYKERVSLRQKGLGPISI